MRRRPLLAALGAGTSLLAGCQGGTGQRTTTARTPTPAPCQSAGPRRVELAQTAGMPEDAALSVAATMERERITADATARLRVTLTNAEATRETDIADEEHCHLFDRSRGGSDPSGLWLYRRQDAPTDREGECWTQTESPANTRTYVAVGCAKRTLAPGESVATTYELWDDYATDDYLPPGTYRFDAAIPVWTASDDGGDDDPDRVLDWWLDLRVTDSES